MTTNEQHVYEQVRDVQKDIVVTALRENKPVTPGTVTAHAHEWAQEASFYDILMLLDVVEMQRDSPPLPSTQDGHWEQNDDEDLQWMAYIRDLGDTAMRHAVMDHLGHLEIGEFEAQDDYPLTEIPE